jgi:hypothetical protein
MQTKQVKDLQDPKYILVQDELEKQAVLESINIPTGYRNDYGCLLVEVLDGEYGEVWAIDWAIDSYVPYLSETAIDFSEGQNP